MPWGARNVPKHQQFWGLRRARDFRGVSAGVDGSPHLGRLTLYGEFPLRWLPRVAASRALRTCLMELPLPLELSIAWHITCFSEPQSLKGLGKEHPSTRILRITLAGWVGPRPAGGIVMATRLLEIWILTSVRAGSWSPLPAEPHGLQLRLKRAAQGPSVS